MKHFKCKEEYYLRAPYTLGNSISPPTLPGHQLECQSSAFSWQDTYLPPHSQLSFYRCCSYTFTHLFIFSLVKSLPFRYVSYILHRVGFCFVNESVNFILLKQLSRYIWFWLCQIIYCVCFTLFRKVYIYIYIF